MTNRQLSIASYRPMPPLWTDSAPIIEAIDLISLTPRDAAALYLAASGSDDAFEVEAAAWRIALPSVMVLTWAGRIIAREV